VFWLLWFWLRIGLLLPLASSPSATSCLCDLLT
jgi:hypothetical protein